jgi:PAS domain S-box-containing protein
MSEEVSSMSKALLVVDDDPLILETLQDILGDEGYQVHAVSHGVAALDAAQHMNFGAALVDIRLPDLDGLTVLGRLMQLDARLPVILLTAQASVQSTIQALNEGAFAYLTKPYHMDELKSTLRRAVTTKVLTEKAEQAEKALRESETRFRSVVESASDAIILANQEGSILSWNQSAERLFGYTFKEVAGKPLTILMPSRYQRRHQEGIKRIKDGGQKRIIGKTVELEGARKDGTEFPLELSLSMWTSHDVIYYSGILRDVTDRKRTEAALRQADKLAGLGTLASGMAHEVNNPVQGIMSMADIIMGEKDVEKISEYARDIITYSAHVATVVRDFCQYARPASRDQEVVVDVNERLEEAVKMVRRSSVLGYIEVLKHFDAVPEIMARRSEIDQVFINLITNAVQAMDGRGSLTLNTEQADGAIKVTIRDSGYGIPAQNLTKIFDPFFTTKDPGKGTGLGLSIVYQLVSKYGGRIGVDSAPGVGTTFIIHLPLQRHV